MYVDALFSPNTKSEHCIVTGSARPVFSRNRPLSPEKENFVKGRIRYDYFMRESYRPSDSAWASAIHLVPKEEGKTYRLCVDYRRLNTVSNTDKYPVPFISAFTHQLHKKRVFSKIDLKQAYHFIKVRESDVPKTAMITPFGLYEWVYMPFRPEERSSYIPKIYGRDAARLNRHICLPR